MTGIKHWHRVQAIGNVVRPEASEANAFLDPSTPSIIRIDPRWEAGLSRIEDFSHLVVLFYLDRAKRRRTVGEPQRPEGLEQLAPVGFFSTRTPRRPNPIGICCPRLVRRVGCDLHVIGLDAWNGTPILDIKGYFPRDELRSDAVVPDWLTTLWQHHDSERATEIAESTSIRASMPLPGTIVAEQKTEYGPITFRYLKESDAESAVEFVNALSREQTFVLFQGEQLTLDEERAWIKGRLDVLHKGTSVTIGVFQDDRYLGAAQIDLDHFVARHVGRFGISIAPAIRGAGIGKLLTESVIAEAEKHLDGLRLIQLDVFANNERGIHLYRKLGFVEYARLPGGVFHRGDYVDLISMYRPVGSKS